MNDSFFKFNYTAVPNEILDNLPELSNKLGDSALRALLFIARKTFGWKKTRDKISYSQIQQGIGCTRANTIIAVKKLVDAGMVKQTSSGDNRPNFFEIIIHDESSIAGNTSFGESSIAGNTDKRKERIKKHTKVCTVVPTVSGDILKILSYWNQSKHTTTHSIDKKSKTLDGIIKNIQMLMDGTFFKNHPIFTDRILAANNIPKDCIQKKFSADEIIGGIESYLLQFEKGYWPYEAAEKIKLQKSLSGCIFSPYNNRCPSILLKLMYNKPKRIDVVDFSAEEKESYKIIEKAFTVAIYNRELKIEEKMKLEKCVSEIEVKRKEYVDGIGKLYLRMKKDNLFEQIVCDSAAFMRQYAKYLKKENESMIQFSIRKNLQSVKGIQILSISTSMKYWEGFVKRFLRNEFNLILEPTQEEKVSIELRAKEIERRMA